MIILPVDDSNQRQKLDEARSDVIKLSDTVAELQRRVENQGTLIRAMFALLQEKVGITEAALLDQFRAALIERAGATPKMCVRCGRAVNLKFQRCMYCDEPQPVGSAFEMV